MPTDTNKRLHHTWGGLRKAVRSGQTRSCTVTFDYGALGFRTVAAPSFAVACQDAAERWGNCWIGEPCYSTPEMIYNDLIGWTKHEHGQDFGRTDHSKRKRDRFRRTGQSYE